MKYVNTGVVFQEIPDEVTLSVNISGCPCRCPCCHSQYLWEDIGEPLNAMSMGELLRQYGDDITCVCLMGGDAETKAVDDLAAWIKTHWPHLAVGWYSGRALLSPDINLKHFDYIKLGPYLESHGPLNKPTTNQRLYHVGRNGKLTDITHRFWKK